MHHPPAVSTWVRASRLTGGLVMIFASLASLQAVIFLTQNSWNTWQSQVIAALLLASIALVLRLSRHRDEGQLQWTGEVWQWSAFPLAGGCVLQLHLDFQVVMLVSLRRPQAATVWLWLERDQIGQKWLAVRRAIVYSVSAQLRHSSTAARATTPSHLA